MADDDKIFNPRTSRYVTKGSTAYRRMICEDRKEKVKREAELKKLNIPIEQKEVEKVIEKVEKVKSKSKSKSIPKEKKSRKQDEKAISELTSLSMKVIKENDEKFRKIRGNQDETDKLLKKLLYEKLAKKTKKSHRSPVKKSRPKSFLDDLVSQSSSDSSSSY